MNNPKESSKLSEQEIARLITKMTEHILEETADLMDEQFCKTHGLDYHWADKHVSLN